MSTALGGPLRSPESLSEMAYRRIRTAVNVGALAPGTSVSEPKASAQLEVSRAALREALIRLASEGYVEQSKSGRWHVVTVTPESVRDTYECRGVVEGLAAALASERADENELEAMRTELVAARSLYAEEQFDETAARSARFHDLVVAAAKNQKLVTLMDVLRPQILHYRVLMLRHATRGREFIDENAQLLVFIETNAPQQAQDQAEASARSDMEAVVELLERGIL